MPHYLLQASYTPEACARMVENPQDRGEFVRPVIEKLGGKMIAAFYALGDYDTIAFVELPDNASATAFSLAAASGGGIRGLKTTPLLTMAEGIEAMRKAAGSGYEPPA